MNRQKAPFWSHHTQRCFLLADAVLALPTEAYDGKSTVQIDGKRMDLVEPLTENRKSFN